MVIIYILIGILGGLLGGMGMGGGTLLIPLLTLCLKVPQPTAQFINLAAFVPMSVVALAVHIKNKMVCYRGLPFLIIPAVVTAAVSAFLMTGVNTEILKKIFGGFLTLLGTIYFFASVYKTKKDKAK